MGRRRGRQDGGDTSLLSATKHRAPSQNDFAVHDFVTHPELKACPSCGAEMVLRTARRGANAGNQFWGCSAYPACKAIVQTVEG